MNIRKILVVQRDWSIGGISFAWRQFRLTGYQNTGMGGQKESRHLLREKRCEI